MAMDTPMATGETPRRIPSGTLQEEQRVPQLGVLIAVTIVAETGDGSPLAGVTPCLARGTLQEEQR